MTDGDTEETTMAAINPGMDHAPRAPMSDEARRAAAAMPMTLWSAAALMETLVLVGGMMWIMSGPGAIGPAGRVLIVAVIAVIGGGVFAIAASKLGHGGTD
jgi:hypothetical protein